MPRAWRMTFARGTRFIRFVSADVSGCASGSLSAAFITCASVIVSNRDQSCSGSATTDRAGLAGLLPALAGRLRLVIGPAFMGCRLACWDNPNDLVAAA